MADTRESLLQAIVQDPDNPLPRLVLADHLDEEGDSDWAELIRLQNGYFQHWSNAHEQRDRERILCQRVQDRFPQVPGVRLGPPVRGLPDRITFTLEKITPEPITLLLRILPITYFDLSEDFPDVLLNVPWLSQARVIDLSGIMLSEDLTLNLLSRARSEHLRALIWRGGVDDATCEVLASLESLAGLRELCLADYIHDAGANALIASNFLDELRYLDLRGNRIQMARHRLERRFGSALVLV